MEHSYQGINIRTDLKAGDIGYIIYLHGTLYKREYNYGISFETYVALGLNEFYNSYDPGKDCVWICEDNNKIIGFLLLMHRDNNAAQLRYFILLPEYRKIGLGKKLMDLFFEWVKVHDYQSCYLWTTNEQQTASALYKKYGFHLTEEHGSSAFGKPVIEQCYELILER